MNAAIAGATLRFRIRVRCTLVFGRVRRLESLLPSNPLDRSFRTIEKPVRTCALTDISANTNQTFQERAMRDQGDGLRERHSARLRLQAFQQVEYVLTHHPPH